MTGDNCHYIRPLPESGLVMAVVPSAHLSASLHSACMRLSTGMMNWMAISNLSPLAVMTQPRSVPSLWGTTVLTQLSGRCQYYSILIYAL